MLKITIRNRTLCFTKMFEDTNIVAGKTLFTNSGLEQNATASVKYVHNNAYCLPNIIAYQSSLY